MIYIYRCKACEKEQEENHSIHENPQITCKECGGTDTQRVIQSRPFHLKNGGWAKDKYS